MRQDSVGEGESRGWTKNDARHRRGDEERREEKRRAARGPNQSSPHGKRPGIRDSVVHLWSHSVGRGGCGREDSRFPESAGPFAEGGRCTWVLVGDAMRSPAGKQAYAMPVASRFFLKMCSWTARERTSQHMHRCTARGRRRAKARLLIVPTLNAER